MYKLDRTIGLVTVASNILQNLALLDVDEYLCADSLAVIHAGYINYIPIINASRRCKYISVMTGIDRGKGCIFSVKWLKVGSETFFVALSSLGIHIYDAELTEPIYHYELKSKKDGKEVIPLGSATVLDYLCVGADNGFVYLFKDQGCHDFDIIHRVEIGEFMLFDGLSRHIVSATRQNIYTWEFNNCLFYHKQKLNTEIIESLPTVLKAAPELALTGYENGELALYSLDLHKTLVRKQAHKAKITALDYSPLKLMVVTGSMDHHIKVWQFDFTHSSLSSIFSLESNHEYCGVGFLNLHGTEFCAVKSENVSIDVFVKVETEYQ